MKPLSIALLILLSPASLMAAEQKPAYISWTFASAEEIQQEQRASTSQPNADRQQQETASGTPVDTSIQYGELGW